jgi:CRISPR-associated exonuclease Cas4/CRISPR-associated protein Cas1
MSEQLSFDLPAPRAAPDEILVPARMVNEWVYCPRLAFLEWAHGEWADSADTTAGRRDHLASDTGRAPALPAPYELDTEKLRTRRVSLGSEALGLTALIDILDAEDGAVVPVDVKTGKRPHVAEGAYLPERVQVCVQGLLLREAGYTCEEGALWFAGSRERVRVPFTDELVAETLRAASELRLAAAANRIPPPLENSPKCLRCSLMPVCLPDEVAWFSRGQIPRTPPPPAAVVLPLYVQSPGARVKKAGETIVVEPVEGETVTVPLGDISELVVAGPVSVTTPTLHELLRREIPVAWTSSGFWFLGTTGGASPRSGAARMAQYRLASDPARRLSFARELVAAKLRNQRTVLRRNWRGAEEDRAAPSDRLETLVRRALHAADMPMLLGIEGEGAAIYFRAFTMLLAEPMRLPFAFERRNRRPPADPINACLSLAYALLTRTVTTALSTVGLDPWQGFYHVERPGRPSLALDLMEPYRPIVADSAVLMAINNGELRPSDFVSGAGGCNLTSAGRRALIGAYERRLDVVSTHPTFGYQVEMRRMLTVQARLLARFLLGEVPHYPHLTPR